MKPSDAVCAKCLFVATSECDGDGCDGTPYEIFSKATVILHDDWQSTYDVNIMQLTIGSGKMVLEGNARKIR